MRHPSHKSRLRFGTSVLAWALVFALVIGEVPPSQAENAPALCDENGLGGEIQSWPSYEAKSDSEFQKKARAFEDKWKRTILERGRPRHLAASRGSGAKLPESTRAQERFFQALFGAGGDIVRACSARKLIQEDTVRLAAARQQAQGSEQCRALKDAKALRTQASSRLQQLGAELKEKFGEPSAANNVGLRRRELSGLRNANHNELDRERQNLGLAYAALKGEAGQLWGKKDLEPNTAFSGAVLQAVRELNRNQELTAKLDEESRKLSEAEAKCGSVQAASIAEDDGKSTKPKPESKLNEDADDQDDDGDERDTRETNPTSRNKGDTSSFLADNWGWLVGGTVVAGAAGGAYYLFQKRAEAQKDDTRAQELYNQMMLEQAEKARATATAVNTSTVTTTATETATDTDTGTKKFPPLPFAGRELEPLEFSFAANEGTALEASNLPKGAVWEPSTSTLRWIPKVGQAGVFTPKVRSGKHEQELKLTISARAASEFKTQGPPDNFRDGDIGYVFIHGAGGEVDRCSAGNDLAQYWGATPNLVSPDPAYRKVACYNGQQAVATQAERVANQIVEANCGRYQKCILITHSMGDLLVNHMFTHIGTPPGGAAEPKLWDKSALYEKARDRTLFVISLASAAGGSKVADILQSSKHRSTVQKIAGRISRWTGMNNEAYKNLQANYASTVVAPITSDPGVPFFMVPGHTKRTLYEEDGVFDIITAEIGMPNAKVFNGDAECATLDYITEFSARSDGLVDFRSACGIADANPESGPGYRGVELDTHLKYCATSPKKPNHYLWFLLNLNHFDIALPTYHCQLAENKCEAAFPNEASPTGFEVDQAYAAKSAPEVIRDRLTRNKSGSQPVQQRVQLGF